MIRAIVPADAEAIAALASRRDVVEHGTHSGTEPVMKWRERIGPADPNRPALMTEENGQIRACVFVTPFTHRRRAHAAELLVLARDDADRELDALLREAVDLCDRWLQVFRIELSCAADHPRVKGLYRDHGFELQVRASGGLISPDRDLADLARLRPGWAPRRAPPIAFPNRASARAAEVKLRFVTPDDGPAFGALMSEPSVVWGTMQFPWQRPDQWSDRFAKNDPDRMLVFVAEIDGVMVGNGAVIIPEEARRRHTAEMGMMVSTAVQGAGIGRAIVRHAIEIAKHRGVTRLELGVYDDNHRAIALYESEGFVREGQQRAHVARDGAYADTVSMVHT